MTASSAGDRIVLFGFGPMGASDVSVWTLLTAAIRRRHLRPAPRGWGGWGDFRASPIGLGKKRAASQAPQCVLTVNCMAGCSGPPTFA
jgi:hypothetical protein